MNEIWSNNVLDLLQYNRRNGSENKNGPILTNLGAMGNFGVGNSNSEVALVAI